MTSLQMLKEIPFFRRLEKEEMEFLLNHWSTYFQDVSSDHYLLREGVHNNTLFVILDGRSLVTRGSRPREVIAELYRGDLFGEMAFLTGRLRSTSVITATPSTLFRATPEIFSTLLPAIQAKMQTWIIATLVKRLDDMNTLLTGITR